MMTVEEHKMTFGQLEYQINRLAREMQITCTKLVDLDRHFIRMDLGKHAPKAVPPYYMRRCSLDVLF